jgi:Protein of unknown function (DUF_B2219)
MFWATAWLLALAASATVTMMDKPVTVAVNVPEKARRSKAVLLQLEGVVVAHNAPAVWNIFWEMPRANAQTSVEDLHFVGYVTSVANSGARDPKPANFTLELPSAAVAVIHRQTTIRLTFVPVRVPNGGVTIGDLRLE